MVPWPIALLSVFYGILAASAAAMAWKAIAGLGHQGWVGPAVWLAISAALMIGLPLLKAWARRLAIIGSGVLLLVALGVAGICVTQGRPGWALLSTLTASFHVLVIRYLQRPSIKEYFGFRNADFEFNPQSEFRNPQ